MTYKYTSAFTRSIDTPTGEDTINKGLDKSSIKDTGHVSYRTAAVGIFFIFGSLEGHTRFGFGFGREARGRQWRRPDTYGEWRR